jgi:hypothetical protein
MYGCPLSQGIDHGDIPHCILYFEGETYVGLFPTGVQNCLYYGIQLGDG